MIRRVALFLVPLLLSGVAAASLAPRALSSVLPGLWEVSARADGHDARRICLSDPRLLMQWQHRTINCGQRLLANGPSSAVIDYNCGPAGFGHSRLTLLTPRTLRVETQGIADNYPFEQVLHARRVGDCRGR